MPNYKKGSGYPPMMDKPKSGYSPGGGMKKEMGKGQYTIGARVEGNMLANRPRPKSSKKY